MRPLPPLVPPTADLDPDEITRYSRHITIPDIGLDGQRRLKTARVLVIGAGGLGSPVLLYLAAAGVGTLGLVEFDVVEASNLQRQVIHGTSDVGRPKAESARDAVAEINPHVRVELYPMPLTTANAVDLFGRYDLIVDGTDNFATRYLVNDAAALAHRPYVWGSILRFAGQASVFWDDAPDGRGVNYRDLYPDPPAPGTVPSCAQGGVFGVLCASIGAVMGTEVVKLICGIGQPLLGRLLIYDALTAEQRVITVARDPAAPPITALADYEAVCGPISPSDTADTPGADTADTGGAVSALDLKRRLDAGEDLTLVDVREPVEWDVAYIAGATLVPQAEIEDGTGLARVPRDRPAILYCRSGIRSAHALSALRAAGYRDASHLDGGILAWVRLVEPTLPVL